MLGKLSADDRILKQQDAKKMGQQHFRSGSTVETTCAER